MVPPVKGVLQEAIKPAAVPLSSEVKTTCRYPVGEVYVLREELPDKRATCSTVLHVGDEQRLMVTKSEPASISKNEKEIVISATEEMSQVQFALLT